jgi:cytochrome c2
MRLACLAFVALAPALACVAGDVEEGRKLVAEHQCENCHHAKTQGDASAVYLRKDRKVTSLAKLKAQVALCNSELSLGLFPEDEEHVTAFLDATYYRFAAK